MPKLPSIMSSSDMTDHLFNQGVISFNATQVHDLEDFDKHYAEVDKEAAKLGYTYDEKYNQYRKS